jgi:hypothetical protein
MTMPETATDKFGTLVERLSGATKSGRLIWKPGFESSAFVAVLERGSVRIARYEELDEYDSPMEWFELAILDRDGRVAERLSSEPNLTGEDSTKFDKFQLAGLFREARTHALDTEGLVDSLIGELE